MKILLALRHAKSSWSHPALEDHERPLNRRGRRDAPRMGALVRRRKCTPDLIISSHAVRARATAQRVAKRAGYAKEILLDERLYAARPSAMVSVLREVPPAQATSVMVVGHNPGLEELVARLTGEEHEMPTAALAQIALPIDRWRDLRVSTRGTLVAIWRPGSR